MAKFNFESLCKAYILVFAIILIIYDAMYVIFWIIFIADEDLVRKLGFDIFNMNENEETKLEYKINLFTF
jgi:hypothetical protein